MRNIGNDHTSSHTLTPLTLLRCGYLRGQFQQLMQVGDNLDELDTTADSK